MTVVVKIDEADLKGIEKKQSDSVQQVMVSGVLYPKEKHADCWTCQSDYCNFIERSVAVGVKYTKLEAHLKDLPVKEMQKYPHPTARSIANHIKDDHVTLDESLQREAMEQAYVASGGSLDDGAETILNRLVVAHAIVQKYGKKVMQKDFDPTKEDFTVANKIIEDFEKTNTKKDGITEDMWRDAMFAYIDTLLPEIPPERREAVSRALETHPAMLAVAAVQLKQQIANGETVEGEVV